MHEQYTFKRSGDIGRDFRIIFQGTDSHNVDPKLRTKFKHDLGSFLAKYKEHLTPLTHEQFLNIEKAAGEHFGNSFNIFGFGGVDDAVYAIKGYWIIHKSIHPPAFAEELQADDEFFVVPDHIIQAYTKRFAKLMGYGEKANVGIDTSVYESKITETKLKQIIKEELEILKKEKEIERNKDQFAHKFSSVFVEALELDPKTETGKNTLNEVYSFLTQYTLNEVLDNWVTYPVSADGSIMYSNPINALPGATPEGVGAGGLIKLFKAGPNDKNVTYAVTVNTGKLNTLGADKVKTEIARLLKTASDKSIDQAQDNTNEIGDPFADDSLSDNAGPLKGLGEAIEYPEDVKATPIALLLKNIADAGTLLHGMDYMHLMELETFGRYMKMMSTDLRPVNKADAIALNNASEALLTAVRTRQQEIRPPRTSLTHKGSRGVTEGIENDVVEDIVS